MPAKKTLQDVKNTLEQLSHGETQLLSTEYQGNKALLCFQCRCGNIFERSYDKLQQGRYLCQDCMLKNKSQHNRMDFKEVKRRINEAGCEYISGEYINNNSVLTLKCKCGNIFTKRMNKFFSGQSRCPQCGFKELAIQKTKYNLESFRVFLSERGYTLLENEYKGYDKKHLCLCPNGHKCFAVLSWMLGGQLACKICAQNKNKGEGSHFYNGGVAIVSDLLRTPIKKWKRDIRKLYNNTCPITGKYGRECDVHHLIAVKTLFNEICLQHGVNVTFKSTVHDFDNYEQFDKIREEFLMRHQMNLGILISKDVHKKFHTLYHNKNFGINDFDVFLKENYNISLSDIMRY